MTIPAGFEERLNSRIDNHVLDSVNEVMGEAIKWSQQNHPGWKTISGKAERSMRITGKARLEGSRAVGFYGFSRLVYGRRLEFQHGFTLHKSMEVVRARFEGILRKRVRRQEG